jgi:hypothetical protein
MSSTGTQTTTYTVADIRKVVDNFAADLSMMAQATGLRSRESVAEIVSDLKVFAEHNYLVEVTLFLDDKDGNRLRAAVYKVNAFAIGWTPDRPGNNVWERTPGGSLWVLAALTNAWWNKTDPQRETFVSERGLHYPWARTQNNTSLSGLCSSVGQKYTSSGYGWQRTNYSKAASIYNIYNRLCLGWMR